MDNHDIGMETQRYRISDTGQYREDPHETLCGINEIL